MSVRVVCISDTHNKLAKVKVPDGDVLVHAGDSTMMGTEVEVIQFNHVLGKLPHRHKIVIAGNHDWLFQTDPALARSLITSATYLEDEAVEVAGLKFWGSPWQPEFCDWAYNLPRGNIIRKKWDLIPDGTDVLVTHGPPRGRLDQLPWEPTGVGCDDLREAVWRVRPQLHVFGHIHTNGGRQVTDAMGPTLYVNAAVCDEGYRPTNAPVVVDL